MPDLDPAGGRLALGRLILQTSNMQGTAELVASRSGGRTRAIGEVRPSTLEEGLGAILRPDGTPMVETTDIVELRAAPPRRREPGRTRSLDDGSAVRLEVPAPQPGHEQAVLSVDESGVTTWTFAPDERRGPKAPRPATRGGGSRTFVVPRPPAAAPGTSRRATDRSILGDVAKQFLKVVSFPIGELAGKVAHSFMEDWEAGHLEYGVRDYLKTNYTEPFPYFNEDPARWAELAKDGQRTLLMIHGTFSRAHGAFNGLPPERMADLQRLYDGRVIAFDHYTVSHSPKENIEKLISIIPEGTSIDLDVICHSRGGLVARSLTEWLDDFGGGRDIRVHRTALVGAVNNGTILADVHHWNELIDMLSTLINTVGVGIPEPFSLVLSFAQDIAEAGYPQLGGLYAMVPGGPFLKDLNVRKPRLSKYLAVASNYEPTDGKLQSFLNDAIKDALFDQLDNDAMVRVDSVCGTGKKDEFKKVASPQILDAKQGIEHSRYFGNAEVADGLVRWLKAGLPGQA